MKQTFQSKLVKSSLFLTVFVVQKYHFVQWSTMTIHAITERERELRGITSKWYDVVRCRNVGSCYAEVVNIVIFWNIAWMKDCYFSFQWFVAFRRNGAYYFIIFIIFCWSILQSKHRSKKISYLNWYVFDRCPFSICLDLAYLNRSTLCYGNQSNTFRIIDYKIYFPVQPIKLIEFQDILLKSWVILTFNDFSYSTKL